MAGILLLSVSIVTFYHHRHVIMHRPTKFIQIVPSALYLWHHIIFQHGSYGIAYSGCGFIDGTHL